MNRKIVGKCSSSKRVIVYSAIVLLIVVGVVFSYSKAYFRKRIEVSDTTLKVGTLEYITTINGSTNSKISVSSHEYAFLDVIITSKNPIDSKYSLVYQVTPSTVNATGYEIAYFDNQDVPSGVIRANEEKRVRIRIYNNNSSAITLIFTTKSSLVNNEVELQAGEKKITQVVNSNYQEYVLNGTDPVLSDNLVPVVIEDDGVVKKADLKEDWYNYGKQIWANAVVLEDKNQTYNVGDTIPESNIQSYFVWIPRYKYKLFNMGEYSSLTGISNTAVQTIEIVFESKETTPVVGTKVGDYHSHPAFQAFDSNGFWIGKFESGYKGAGNKTEAQVNSSDYSKLVIKPNVYSWRNISVGNAFKISYDYLRDDESHMMKNTEWGAVAYLQHSEYGSRESVKSNNNRAYMTGYASVSEPTCGITTNNDSATCNLIGTTDEVTQSYNTEIGYTASTTGNISGVYDMSGGAWEYVMGYNTRASKVGGESGLTSIYSNFFTSTDWEKYYDKYSIASNTVYNARILGDATGEIGPFANVTAPDGNTYHTSGWHSDYAYSLDSTHPWFARGGPWAYGSMAGDFAFSNNTGSFRTSISFRIILTL